MPGGRTAFPAKKPRYSLAREEVTCQNSLVKSGNLYEANHERHKKLIEVALQRLTARCHLQHLTVNTWVEPVRDLRPRPHSAFHS